MRSGFSIIEMLVVMSILILLTSTLVLYNRAGERQIIVLREKARLIGTILRAKSLALNTLIEDEPACGYGVHAEEGKYFIFSDRAIDCGTSDRIYGSSSDVIVADTEVVLDQAVGFESIGAADIVFVPPDPKVFLNGGTALDLGTLVIASPDGTSRGTITITNAGQISER